MKLMILLLPLVLIAIGILALKSKAAIKTDEVWPYLARPLLSTPEQVLYFRLVKALPEHIVLAQVQLSRFLGVKKGNNVQAWTNRINRMSADFVVCNKDLRAVAVVELDDASHNREERQAADSKKDKALSAGGIRVIRWQVKTLPDENTISETFNKVR